MTFLRNPYRGVGLDASELEGTPFPSTTAEEPSNLLARCPAARTTPLIESAVLRHRADVAQFFLKNESDRMGLGSFKALGAAYVIAYEAEQTGLGDDPSKALEGRTFVTASAGNHGLSVAAGARIFGANAIVFLASTVPKAFAERLEEQGAEVRFTGDNYAASMNAAMKTAADNGHTLLSDSSWPGYHALPHRLMEGYLVMAAEMVEQMERAPTHLFLQAGVGGLAAAVAAYARKAWGDEPTIVVVEPEAAPALIESIRQGQCVTTQGPASNMGRLDCKEPSLIALKGLSRDADIFMTISDDHATHTAELLRDNGLPTTPSGAAGVAAALLPAQRDALGLNRSSRVAAIVSEGPA